MSESALLKEPQSASSVLMVRPARFGFNPETAASNAFQERPGPGGEVDLQALAVREFDVLAERLRKAGVDLIIVDDTPEPAKPDALFPNNWVSFHRDGTVVLYPMLAPNRRIERREEVIREVLGAGAFRTTRTVDLSYRELQGKYLEGTGSLVLDRTRPHRLRQPLLAHRSRRAGRVRPATRLRTGDVRIRRRRESRPFTTPTS